jgi:mRNA-capping enzyme
VCADFGVVRAVSSVFDPKLLVSGEKKAGDRRITHLVSCIFPGADEDVFYQESEYAGLGVSVQKLRLTRAEGNTGSSDASSLFPSSASLDSFISMVFSFYQGRGKDAYLAVECPLGINTSGVLVVHALVLLHKMSVKQALDAFRHARPPGIYNAAFVEALFALHAEEPPKGWLQQVMLPTWWPLEALAADANAGAKRNGRQQALPRGSVCPSGTVYPGEQVGVEVTDPAELQALRRTIYTLCTPLNELSSQPDYVGTFPGAQVVSFTHASVDEQLRRWSYYVTWKSDGSRFLMLSRGEGTYLIDRSFRFFQVHVYWPSQPPSAQQTRPAAAPCLIDGELVEEGGKYVFLVFDSLTGERGRPVLHKPLTVRLAYLQTVLFPLRKEAGKAGLLAEEPFEIRLKDYYKLKHTKWVLRERLQEIGHETDGLIFQPRDQPYVKGTDARLLKWKPSDQNTVDFLVRVVREESKVQLLVKTARNKPHAMFDEVMLQGEDNVARWSEVDGKIVECLWENGGQSWRIYKVREDKDSPNSMHVARGVLDSIQDGITEEVLLDLLRQLPEGRQN